MADSDKSEEAQSVSFFHQSPSSLLFGILNAGLSQAGGPGGYVPPHFLSDQLTLSQPGGAHCAHHINACPPGFSDFVTALQVEQKFGSGQVEASESKNGLDRVSLTTTRIQIRIAPKLI